MRFIKFWLLKIWLIIISFQKEKLCQTSSRCNVKFLVDKWIISTSQSLIFKKWSGNFFHIEKSADKKSIQVCFIESVEYTKFIWKLLRMKFLQWFLSLFPLVNIQKSIKEIILIANYFIFKSNFKLLKMISQKSIIKILV